MRGNGLIECQISIGHQTQRVRGGHDFPFLCGRVAHNIAQCVRVQWLLVVSEENKTIVGIQQDEVPEPRLFYQEGEGRAMSKGMDLTI